MKRIAVCLGLIFWTLASFTANAQGFPRGDVTQDGIVNIADVTCLIDYLLNDEWPYNHDWVDMGLPSGTLWATCNVGANTPEEYGDYFAWGETAPKDYYDWSTYKWCNGSSNTLTKYCTNSDDGYNGFVDNKTELDTEDDAAYVNWGPAWRMPTTEQQRELYENCTPVWITQNGVNGYLFTGPNGNTLFLPAAGSHWRESLYNEGSWGDYWSRTLSSSVSYDALDLYFGSGRVSWSNQGRLNGFSVRAVRELSWTLASFTANAQDYPRGDVTQDGTVNIADVTCLIDYLLTGTWTDDPVTPPDEHECVDLGLPSGTLWATCNVGANTPEQYGDYFAWGETAPKDYYDWGTYKWCNGTYNTLTKYCTESEFGYNGLVDNKTELDPEDDAAYVNWGPSWRMPSLEQRQELKNNCTWVWTTQNGVNGCLFTGPNGNTLFLPATGSRLFESFDYAGSRGNYWSRTLYSGITFDAYGLGFDSGNVSWGYASRYIGYTVRAVHVSQN